MNRCLVAFPALLSASLTISSACLADPAGQATRLIRYNDLDLSTPDGLKALDRRIELTANQVCMDVSGPSPGGQVDLGCKADAVAGARLQIQGAIAQQRLGRSPAVAVIEVSPAAHHPKN